VGVYGSRLEMQLESVRPEIFPHSLALHRGSVAGNRASERLSRRITQNDDHQDQLKNEGYIPASRTLSVIRPDRSSKSSSCSFCHPPTSSGRATVLENTVQLQGNESDIRQSVAEGQEETGKRTPSDDKLDIPASL
jgi:hypothetical protein